MTTVVLDGLPAPSERRLAVRVTPDALRRIRGGHPWVFDGSITSVTDGGRPGDLAVIFDQKRRFAAIGLFDPGSPIRVRILHVGSPSLVDTGFWTDRVIDALDRRRSVIYDPTTTGYRCVHGENDGLPGLVVDRFGSTLVVKVYSAAWIPHLADVVPVVHEAIGADRTVLRLARNLADDAPDVLRDAPTVAGTDGPDVVTFAEGGLVFEADVRHGQKTGHFLDQRENRMLVGDLADGARILDVFCCTGGFGVHAAAGGAVEVHSVDQSPQAVANAAANMARNRDRTAHVVHRTSTGDAFEVLRDLARRGARHDIVVVDPPSFASRQGQVEGALRSYALLTHLALAVLEPGGMLVQSSCSSRVDERTFHDTIRRAAETADVGLTEWARTTHAVDHPIGFPEGAYLKTLFARTRRR